MKIEVRGLEFSYKKKAPRVLNGVSLTLFSGEIAVLVGANGSGKTTLTKILLGLNKPNAGEVLFDDVVCKKLSAGKRAERIGYLFQNADLQLFAATVLEELYFPFQILGTLDDDKKAEVDKLLDTFRLRELKDRFPLTMSGGEKQRLALATVMSRPVEFLIFDEPTSVIDSDGKEFITNFVKDFANKGGGVLVITHDEEFLQKLSPTRILHMQGGIVSES